MSYCGCNRCGRCRLGEYLTMGATAESTMAEATRIFNEQKAKQKAASDARVAAFKDRLAKMSPAQKMLSTGGAILGAYHGYKRNDSVLWAVVWSVLGGLSPLITGAVAVAQGVGKRKG